MQVYDLHVHSRLGADPAAFAAKLKEAGVSGAAVFSPKPGIDDSTYEDRISFILSFCQNYPGVLYPVLWLDPLADGAVEMVKDSAARGIAGYKVMCSGYYIYEDKPMEVMRAVAAVKKPVCFHTGILWDGKPSGHYNRPVHWECLLEVPGLKFSMGHCSWPWYDECIAVYGKFQNAYSLRRENCEMFLDLTPGTPVPYRRDLLTKLFTVGYDVKHNILFGTDCNTDYRAEWSRKWQDLDNGIYDELGICAETRQCIYRDNFMRFYGITSDTVTNAKLTSDGS
jgi:predicted TIM-barrel fold metal-dependent hydrolase